MRGRCRLLLMGDDDDDDDDDDDGLACYFAKQSVR